MINNPNNLIIYMPEYRKYFKEVIYINKDVSFKENYADPISTRRLIKINFDDYLYHDLCFKRKEDINILNKYDIIVSAKGKTTFNINRNFYAYAILINPLCSNIVPIDMDYMNETNVNNLTLNMLNNKNVKYVNLFLSSLTNYHIHVGLKKHMNILPLINKWSNCDGYKNIINQKLEVLLRVSQKFYTTSENYQLKYLYSYLKENNETHYYTDYKNHLNKDNIWPRQQHLEKLKEEDYKHVSPRLCLRDSL